MKTLPSSSLSVVSVLIFSFICSADSFAFSLDCSFNSKTYASHRRNNLNSFGPKFRSLTERSLLRHSNRSPKTATLSLAANMLEPSSIASGIGYVIGAGSVFLYTPMIYRVVRRGSADGLSPSTWLMKFFCYSFNSAYNIYHEYPLSSYSEIIALWLQAALMLFLVCWFQRQWWPLLAAATIPAAATLAGVDGIAPWLSAGQAAASAVGSGAVIPQIVLNARRGGSGEFSAVTASLLTAGNALRAWTTITVTHDPILLAGFGAGVRYSHEYTSFYSQPALPTSVLSRP